VLDLDRGPVYARCGHLLPRIASAELDCVSDALALLLAARGVSDVLTPFGCDWRFDLVEAGGRTGPALPPSDQDDRLAERTGWRPLWTMVGPASFADWHRTLQDGNALAVVADAYHLPWVPYAGREHMEHGFVVEGLDGNTAHVVDPYDNVTEWGRATPRSLQTSLDVLQPALPGARWCVLCPAAAGEPIAAASMIVDNASAIMASVANYGLFVEQYQNLDEPALQHLALQTWLLYRSRALHARWLAAPAAAGPHPAAADRFRPVTQAWQRAAEGAYLALRRVRGGRAVPAGAMQSLRTAVNAELAVAAELLGPAGKAGPPC